MKFKVGDQVIVTAGKDKGKKSVITKVLVETEKVVVENCNMYVRHVRKYAGQAGQKTEMARAMSTAKVAILNEKGDADRIGYKFEADGTKVRIYKKTGTVIEAKKQEKAVKAEKKEVKKAEKKTEKKEAKEKKTK